MIRKPNSTVFIFIPIWSYNLIKEKLHLHNPPL